MHHRAHALVAALAALAGSLVGGPLLGHPQQDLAVRLPSRTGGCAATAPAAGSPTTVALAVSQDATQAAMVAPVCLDGQGPYPFLIDTGSDGSVVDLALARRLGLPEHGPALGAGGIGCTTSAQPVSLTSWSVGGVALDPQTVEAVDLAGAGTGGRPVGLLGSDVLARFGAVRFDLTAGALVLPGPEGAPLPPGITAPGSGPPTPADLVPAPPAATIGVQVEAVGGAVQARAQVRFGSGPPHPFVVDTGAGQSVVDTTLALAAGRPPTGAYLAATSLCATVDDPVVASGRWSAGGVGLPPAGLISASFGVTATLGGFEGLLGCDLPAAYGSAVLDYRGGRLLLGER